MSEHKFRQSSPVWEIFRVAIGICHEVNEARGEKGKYMGSRFMESWRKTCLRLLEVASNFVCTEHVSMRHYLETTFLEEADVSTVSLEKDRQFEDSEVAV